MVKYFCDKCGKELEEYEVFTITIFPPEIRSWADNARTGDCIFCTKCVEEFQKELTTPMRDIGK